MTFNKGILLGVVSIFIVACSPMEKDNGTITVITKLIVPFIMLILSIKHQKE